MDQRVVIGVALVVGIGLGVAGARLLGGGEAEPEGWKPPEAVSQVKPIPAPEAPDVSWQQAAKDLPPQGSLPPEAEKYPQYFEDLGGEPTEEEEPTAIPTRIEYPMAEKLLPPEPVSEVPHEVVGAWDEARDSPEPGRRRAFVVVVKPDASDAEIEALARDIRASQDSPMLDVRIYDSAKAARDTGMLDGGAARYEHLVGEIKVNQAVPIDLIRVRGRRIDL